MNSTDVFKLSDCQLSEQREAMANEIRRRAQVAVNGQDPVALIRGNEVAKRAVVVAAAGKHSILFVGPSNSGKTMLRAVCLELGLDDCFEARSCRCGNRGDPQTHCSCTLKQLDHTYSSFPLADITVEVVRAAARELLSALTGTGLEEMRERLGCLARHKSEHLTEDAESLLKCAIRELGVDPAAVSCITRVARTIANLDGEQHINAMHMSEAINYRALRRCRWE